MAPSPEYDKEPKAPDKSATNISSEDSKLLHNLVNDQHHSSDHKTTNAATNSEVEVSRSLLPFFEFEGCKLSIRLPNNIHNINQRGPVVVSKIQA